MSVCARVFATQRSNRFVQCTFDSGLFTLYYSGYWLPDPSQSIKNQKDSALKFLIAKTHQIINQLFIKFLSFLSTDIVLRRGQITFQRFQISNPGELISARARHKAFTSTEKTIYQMSIYNNSMVGI